MPERVTSPLTLKVLAILADGEWHRREEVIGLAGTVIPPGRAMRVRERERNRILRKTVEAGKKPGGARVRSDDYRIAVGRKLLVVDVLNKLVGIEHKMDDAKVRWVRSVRASRKEANHPDQ